MWLCGVYPFAFIADIPNGHSNCGFGVFGTCSTFISFGCKENWTNIILGCSERKLRPGPLSDLSRPQSDPACLWDLNSLHTPEGSSQVACWKAFPCPREAKGYYNRFRQVNPSLITVIKRTVVSLLSGAMSFLASAIDKRTRDVCLLKLKPVSKASVVYFKCQLW